MRMYTTTRAALAALLLAATLQAEAVYMTAKGKTYHRTQACMSLTRARQIYQAERSAAEAHGLKPCGICYRAKKAKQAPAAAEWLKPAPKRTN